MVEWTFLTVEASRRLVC